jgi:hypothetical protein
MEIPFQAFGAQMASPVAQTQTMVAVVVKMKCPGKQQRLFADLC